MNRDDDDAETSGDDDDDTTPTGTTQPLGRHPVDAPTLAVGSVLQSIAAHESGGYGNPVRDLLLDLQDAQAGGGTGDDRLIRQAVVLDKLFQHLTMRSMHADTLAGLQGYLGLALKAQAQCRATLQTVSDIRHPRQPVIREQYNAGGHLQVNRDGHGAARENRPTELSEGTRDELHPNGGAPAGVAGAGDADEAVGVVHRTANG